MSPGTGQSDRGSPERPLAPGVDEHGPHHVEVLHALAGAEYYALHRRVRMNNRDPGLPEQPGIEAPEEAASANQVDTTHQQVLGQFGCGLGEAGGH